MRSNGQVTKQIYAAMRSQSGQQLRETVTRLLSTFPLSSTKLVYDSDAKQFTAANWSILLDCCRETDKAKLQHMNSMFPPVDGKPRTQLGRFSEC